MKHRCGTMISFILGSKKVHFCICSDAGASQTAADLFGDDDMEVRFIGMNAKLRLLCFRLDGSLKNELLMVQNSTLYTRWWFHTFSIFTPGEMIQFDWRISFKWVGSTTNYC